MDQQLVIEILWNIGQFFVHPVFYLALAAAVAAGYFRVKRERRDYRTRLSPGWTELKGIFSGAWLGILASALLFAVGVLYYPEFLLLLAVVALVALVSFQFQVLSAAYIIPVAVVIWFIIYQLSYTLYAGPFTFSASNFSVEQLWSIGVLVGLLLVIEGIVLKKQGLKIISPQAVRTKRGGSAVQYKTKQIWLVPMIFLIPGDWFGTYQTFWPLVEFGETSFALVAFPLVIGFQQLTRSSYVAESIPKRAKEILYLGIGIVILSISGIFVAWIGVVALVLAFVLRMYLDSRSYHAQNTGYYKVAPVAEGIQIAGVLQGSPADKMGLEIGERIMKVNGQRVFNEQQLYEAIQINAAHCRLEVLDHNNELRLKQHVLFRHDHHRLGLMIARPTS